MLFHDSALLNWVKKKKQNSVILKENIKNGDGLREGHLAGLGAKGRGRKMFIVALM